MKNIITFFLVGSLVLSLSCKENHTEDNSKIQHKQVVEKDPLREEKVQSADADKNSVEEEKTQSVSSVSNEGNKDWRSDHIDRNKDLRRDYNKRVLKTRIKGVYLKLFTISYEAFLKDDHIIIPEHKKIENYTIRIYEGKKYFYVDFNPKRHPDPEVALKNDGGVTPYGQEMYYIIEKQTFKIKARYFRR